MSSHRQGTNHIVASPCRPVARSGIREYVSNASLPKEASVLVLLDNLTARLRSHRAIKVLQVPGHAIRYSLPGEKHLPNGKLPPTLARRHTTAPREDHDPKLRDYPQKCDRLARCVGRYPSLRLERRACAYPRTEPANRTSRRSCGHDVCRRAEM